MAETVHVAIGGNVGDVEQNLAEAVRMIDALAGVAVTAASPLYRTTPVGGPLNSDGTPAQPDFLNGAIALETTLLPRELMEALLEIELELGRRRLVADGPRTVDLDIVLWSDRVIEDVRVTVPHPRMHLRDFVLRPLADIAAAVLHPGLGKSVAELFAALPKAPLEVQHPVPERCEFAPFGRTGKERR